MHKGAPRRVLLDNMKKRLSKGAAFFIGVGHVGHRIEVAEVQVAEVRKTGG